MSRKLHPRLDSAIVVTERGLEIVPAAEVPRRAKLWTREHAEETLAALTKDPVAVTVRERPVDSLEADFGRERGSL